MPIYPVRKKTPQELRDDQEKRAALAVRDHHEHREQHEEHEEQHEEQWGGQSDEQDREIRLEPTQVIDDLHSREDDSLPPPPEPSEELEHLYDQRVQDRDDAAHQDELEQGTDQLHSAEDEQRQVQQSAEEDEQRREQQSAEEDEQRREQQSAEEDEQRQVQQSAQQVEQQQVQQSAEEDEQRQEQQSAEEDEQRQEQQSAEDEQRQEQQSAEEGDQQVQQSAEEGNNDVVLKLDDLPLVSPKIDSPPLNRIGYYSADVEDRKRHIQLVFDLLVAYRPCSAFANTESLKIYPVRNSESGSLMSYVGFVKGATYTMIIVDVLFSRDVAHDRIEPFFEFDIMPADFNDRPPIFGKYRVKNPLPMALAISLLELMDVKHLAHIMNAAATVEVVEHLLETAFQPVCQKVQCLMMEGKRTVSKRNRFDDAGTRRKVIENLLCGNDKALWPFSGMDRAVDTLLKKYVDLSREKSVLHGSITVSPDGYTVAAKHAPEIVLMTVGYWLDPSPPTMPANSSSLVKRIKSDLNLTPSKRQRYGGEDDDNATDGN